MYPWNHDYPYSQEELNTGKQLLNLLPAGAISQKDLADTASQLSLKMPKTVPSNWLDGYWRSYPGPLREAGYTLTVLLEQDIETIRQEARQSGKSFGMEAQRWTLPIPLGRKLQKVYHQWRREGVYPVAPSEIVTYDLKRGAQVCL
jgi:CRISPR-associated endonuclease/helicase Cas3